MLVIIPIASIIIVYENSFKKDCGIRNFLYKRK